MGIRTVICRSALGALSAAALVTWLVPANAQPSAALTGRVTSAAEGAMEGVLVSAETRRLEQDRHRREPR